MRTLLVTSVAIALAAVWLVGCDNQHRKAAPPPQTYESREIGSSVAPSNDASFQMMAAQGPDRFENFRKLIVSSDKRCIAVTRAVLVGALDGTDEWQVNCSDSGAWQVWFKPYSGQEVAHCEDPKCQIGASSADRR
jgi:hypothetical protein